ncbi:MAG: HesA/MoeB/ThiF family protein [Odoribacteraceae bacterium]|nr:HesA/MoeB/ThiF family protein [Odoribacteraceae bacterium]
MDYTDEQLQRYSRNILLQEIGDTGQQRLLASRVLIVGLGGLGSPVAYYLAAAGIGTIGLIDGEQVETSNLQRQIIHLTPDIGKPKTTSARQKINALNPDTRVIIHPDPLDPANALPIITDYDFIVEATDNFTAKYLVNDTCILAAKPFSTAGINRFNGQTLTRVPGAACYRCLFPAPPSPDDTPTCSRAGILGAVAGILGAIQAAETIKIITGAGTPLTNRLLLVDAKTMNFKTVKIKKTPACPACGNHQHQTP